MKRITEYLILFDENCEALGNEVESYIRDGWQPFGGLCCRPADAETPGDESTLYQAMVKYDE